MSKIAEIIPEAIKEAWEWFINVGRGRRDIKSRVAVLANPENWKSMSNLTPSQAEFVQDACWLAKQEDCYKPMEEYAQEGMEVSPSKGGLGREQTIRLMGALSESKFLSKLGINVKGEDKEA